MPLWAAQVIFPGDGSPVLIRLNEEIRAEAVATVKPHVLTEPYTQIALNDLSGIEQIRLSEPEDINAGHVTIIWRAGTVFISFDFRRNKSLAASLVQASEEFLEAARHAKDEVKSWSVFVDNLYSSLELSVKAFLWTTPWGQSFKARMHHTTIRSAFATYPVALNNMAATASALEALAKERNVARYLHEAPVPRWDEGEAWFSDAEQMLERAEAQVALNFPAGQRSSRRRVNELWQ